MTFRKVTAIAVAGCFVMTLLPASALASDGASAVKPSAPAATAPVVKSVDLRAAARDAAKAIAQPSAKAKDVRYANSPSPMRQGGGGKSGMIIGLVSTAVGIGMGYFMYKQIKKTTDTTATSGQ